MIKFTQNKRNRDDWEDTKNTKRQSCQDIDGGVRYCGYLGENVGDSNSLSANHWQLTSNLASETVNVSTPTVVCNSDNLRKHDPVRNCKRRRQILTSHECEGVGSRTSMKSKISTAFCRLTAWKKFGRIFMIWCKCLALNLEVQSLIVQVSSYIRVEFFDLGLGN